MADLEVRVEVGRQIGLLNAWLVDQGQVPTISPTRNSRRRKPHCSPE
jgi:hypothetical protein